MNWLTSARLLSTISSILAGWIRPSSTKYPIARLATSLRIGSKQLRTIDSGVSSTIRSTPVRDSIVRIFLPSLPMILPFISSFGNDTTDTVLSFVTSWAYFWIAAERISFAFFSAVSLACSSSSRMYEATSSLISSSVFFITISFASSKLSCAISNSFVSCSLIVASSFKCFSSSADLRSSKDCSLRSKFSSRLSRFKDLLSREFSRAISLSSWDFITAFLSLMSLLHSDINLYVSCFASMILSFLICSASFSASSFLFLHSSSVALKDFSW